MAKRTAKYARSRREDEEIERSFRSISPAKKKRKKAKKSHSKAAGCAVFLAVIAVVVAVAAGYFYFSDMNLDGVILENITVAGVDVGGMTQRDAITAVENATANTYGTKTMTVTVLDTQAELPANCCSSLDIRAAVKDAYRFGNSGTQSKREEQQQIAMNEGYAVDLTPYLSINETAIKDALSTIGDKYSTTLAQSTYEVVGESPEQTLVIQLGVPEYGLDMNALYQQVLKAYSENTFSVEGQCGMIKPDPIDLQSIWEQYFIEPVDASFTDKTFEIIEGKDGYGFDLEKAKQDLENAPYGTKLEIPFVSIAPEVTAQSLKDTLFRDKLATYTATHESDADRDVNLALACQAINGKVLYPGEMISYNEALGERTEARGYRPGESYAGNEVVKTIGGGICQVSSCLYYCAMVADLQILLRENHGFASTYVPLGMDATVSWGSLDFRFRNSSDYPIRIEAEAHGGDTTVTIYGTDTKDTYVKMEYEKLKTTEYETTYKTLPADNEEGYKDGDYIVEPSIGYEIKTYRCRYSKDTDELISRDYEASSSYRKRDAVICKIEGGETTPTEEETTPDSNAGVSDAPGALPPE